MPAWRRLQQFYAAITARVSPAEYALAAQLLTPAELRLFEHMPRFDQRHALDVYRALLQAGYRDPLLLKAALLHDCGKVDDDGRPIPLIYYGLFVIMQRLVPALYSLAARNGRGLLRPFAIHAAHDERSAHLVEQAGSSAELAALLRDYGGPRATERAAALRRADEQH